VRVIVLSDAIGALTSGQAGGVLAAGWPGAETTVLPAGAAAAGVGDGKGGVGPAPVDLVVTGCTVFDFATRGGGVVAAAAKLAADLLAPCIVIAGEVVIGSREMRTMGIEAAYAVRTSTADQPTASDVTADELAAVANRVAKSWTW
jgi:glycerate kinase